MFHKNGAELPESEMKILEVLKDGKPHKRMELIMAFGDEFTSPKTLNVHITRIRHVLRPKGQDIICELKNRGINYRWVRLLGPDDE